MTTTLLLATNNPHKVEEFRSIFLPYDVILQTPADLGIFNDVIESGNTYLENACLKAQPYWQDGQNRVLADDSGLEVDALNGEPGIRSSRYAGEGATDTDRVNFLLDKLKDIPYEKRTARFRCVIAIAHPDDKVIYCYGKCEGIITFEPRGTEGFGYDPIFYFPELEKTMAELSPEIKNSISHRARAAREARITLSGI